jgi:formylmethanofuran dehydrogenase subunit E
VWSSFLALAKKNSMRWKPVTVVKCERCQERVAEIVADDRRALCSPCHLKECEAKGAPETTPPPEA